MVDRTWCLLARVRHRARRSGRATHPHEPARADDQQGTRRRIHRRWSPRGRCADQSMAEFSRRAAHAGPRTRDRAIEGLEARLSARPFPTEDSPRRLRNEFPHAAPARRGDVSLARRRCRDAAGGSSGHARHAEGDGVSGQRRGWSGHVHDVRGRSGVGECTRPGDGDEWLAGHRRTRPASPPARAHRSQKPRAMVALLSRRARARRASVHPGRANPTRRLSRRLPQRTPRAGAPELSRLSHVRPAGLRCATDLSRRAPSLRRCRGSGGRIAGRPCRNQCRFSPRLALDDPSHPRSHAVRPF